jgi:Apea-like HEPN
MASDSGDKEQFRNALSAWIRAALSRATPNDALGEERRVWEPGTQGMMVPNDVVIGKWWPSFHATVFGLPEWKAAEESASHWEPLARHLGRFADWGGGHYQVMLLSELTRPFLPEPGFDGATSTPRLPAFDPNALNALFEQFAAFIESDVWLHVTTRLLFGLRVEGVSLPVRLSEDVLLDELSSREVEQYGEAGLIPTRPMSPKDLYAWTGLPWLVVRWAREAPKLFLGKVPKIAGSDLTEATNESAHVLDSVVASLAITKFGAVGLGGGALGIGGWPFGATGITSTTTSVPPFSASKSRSMTLTSDDCRALQEIFAVVRRRGGIQDGLRIAQRRLSDAMETEGEEDRLLSGMIAAEAIFGDSEPSDGIKFKFALRSAYLLEPGDPKRRREIFEDMQNAYDVRSAIVHGTKLSKKKTKEQQRIGGAQVSIADFVERIEDYIRAALREALMSSTGEFNPKWNDKIIGPSPEKPPMRAGT